MMMCRTILATVALVAAFSAASALAPIPGSQFMTRGLDMVSAVQNSAVTGKVLLPIFDLTYTSGQTYTDASDPSLTWEVPDQLSAVGVDASMQEIDQSIQSSYNSYLNEVKSGFSVGVGVSISDNGTQAFSANAKFNHESHTCKTMFQNKSTASAYARHYWATHQLESYPPELMQAYLSPMFKNQIAMLPDTISSPADQKSYNNVVAFWGTHYATLANFGGNMHLNTFVKKSFMQKHSSSWVENQFSVTFNLYMVNLTGGVNFNHTHGHVNSTFADNSQTFIFYHGGDLTEQGSPKVAADWIKSIPANPKYLNVTLAGLETLILDDAKATQLGKVISVYIKTGHLPSAMYGRDYAQFYSHVDYELRRP